MLTIKHRAVISAGVAACVVLALMLPIVFRERYEHGKAAAQARIQQPGASLEYELIACEAKYSNFRRFEVFSRIR